MLTHFKNLGHHMSIKIHYLHSHLDYFTHNLGHLSDECRERFHEDIKTMEDGYQYKWDTNMIAENCWGLMRDSKNSSRKLLNRFCVQIKLIKSLFLLNNFLYNIS